MRYSAILLALFLAPALHAAEPMSASEFDAYTTGKTLFYRQNGALYGAEMYMEGRKVKWSFLDGECKEGYWYPQGDEFCFVYEDRPEPICQIFFRGTGGLKVEFTDGQPQPEIYEARDLDDEMICLGPKTGV